MYIPGSHPHCPVVFFQYRTGEYKQQQGAGKIKQYPGYDAVGGSPSARRPDACIITVKVGYAAAGNNKALYRARIGIKIIEALEKQEIHDASYGKQHGNGRKAFRGYSRRRRFGKEPREQRQLGHGIKMQQTEVGYFINGQYRAHNIHTPRKQQVI